MADFLILREDSEAQTWVMTQIVRDTTATEMQTAVRQGFVGEGHYAVCRWDTRVEFDMAPGAIDVQQRPATTPP